MCSPSVPWKISHFRVLLVFWFTLWIIFYFGIMPPIHSAIWRTLMFGNVFNVISHPSTSNITITLVVRWYCNIWCCLDGNNVQYHIEGPGLLWYYATYLFLFTTINILLAYYWPRHWFKLMTKLHSASYLSIVAKILSRAEVFYVKSKLIVFLYSPNKFTLHFSKVARAYWFPFLF